MNKIFRLVLWVVICETVGVLGSIFTVSSINTWYQTLNKPFFTPPNYVFGPVWIILYALMGISLFLVLEKKMKKGKNLLLILFSLQLLFNFLWSLIFFGFHMPLIAFLDIAILWIILFLVIADFLRVSKTAGSLLIPYILWVTFAAALNLSIVLLN